MKPLPQPKLLLAIALLACSPLHADSIKFSAEQVSSSLARGREHTLLKGNVIVDINNAKITTDEMDIYGSERDILTAKGQVLVLNSEQGINIQGNSLFYNRKTKLLRMRDNVELEDLNNEVIVYANFIEYNEDQDSAQMQINVRIFTENITTRSEFAEYQRESQILTLTGEPVVYKDEDIYRAARIFVNLETEDITLDDGVQGEIITENR